MKVRLHEACQINGAVYPRDSIVEVPDNWVGPKRLQRKNQDRIDYGADPNAVNRIIAEFEEGPRYDVVDDNGLPVKQPKPAAKEAAKPPPKENPKPPPNFPRRAE